MPRKDNRTVANLSKDPVKHAAYRERKRLARLARAADPEFERERKRRWRAANPVKASILRKAHHAVEIALANGNLVKPDRCQLCEAQGEIEAHHHLGYEEKHWLSVLWVCVKCHAKQHRA